MQRVASKLTPAMIAVAFATVVLSVSVADAAVVGAHQIRSPAGVVYDVQPLPDAEAAAYAAADGHRPAKYFLVTAVAAPQDQALVAQRKHKLQRFRQRLRANAPGDWLRGVELARGGYGRVFDTARRPGPVAIPTPVVMKSVANGPTVHRETEVQRALFTHGCAVPRVYDDWVAGHEYVIVMERLGSVPRFVGTAAAGALSAAARVKHWGAQLMTAVLCIHRAGYVHRDLKVDNVMLTRPATGREDAMDLRVIDFGGAIPIPAERDAHGGDLLLTEHLTPEECESDEDRAALVQLPAYIPPAMQLVILQEKLEAYAVGLLLIELAWGYRWQELIPLYNPAAPGAPPGPHAARWVPPPPGTADAAVRASLRVWSNAHATRDVLPAIVATLSSANLPDGTPRVPADALGPCIRDTVIGRLTHHTHPIGLQVAGTALAGCVDPAAAGPAVVPGPVPPVPVPVAVPVPVVVSPGNGGQQQQQAVSPGPAHGQRQQQQEAAHPGPGPVRAPLPPAVGHQ